MWSVKALLKHRNAFNPLSKLKMFPGKPHCGFSYSTVRHEGSLKDILSLPNNRYAWGLKDVLNHPNDFFPLLKLNMAMKKAEKQIPRDPNGAFCYSILPRVSTSFALIIQQLCPKSRDIE
nr:squalene synthase [Tanacetum cinerariifolium]